MRWYLLIGLAKQGDPKYTSKKSSSVFTEDIVETRTFQRS